MSGKTDQEVVYEFCRNKGIAEYEVFKNAADMHGYSRDKMMGAFKTYLYEEFVPEFVKRYIVKEMNADAETPR